MLERDLAQKFPNMTPVRSAPALFRMNGCGVGLYGKRDRDEETGTYVATWCVCLLFVPLLALRAYRVAPARSNSWYFLGREPLSAFARFWNLALIVAALGVAGAVQYQAYTSTPEYRAKVQMRAAADATGKGHLAEAANIYESVVAGSTPQAANAAVALQQLMTGPLQEAGLEEAASVLASATQVARRTTVFAVSDVAATGLKLVQEKGNADAPHAVEVLDVLRPLVVDTRPIDDRRVVLLKKWAEKEPSNLKVLVPLASLLSDKDPAEAKRLLLPVRSQLGDGEGARVLGTILGREGDDDGAYALLWPYVKNRLDALHNAEGAAENVVKKIWDREISELQHDKAPADFYAKYDNASKDEKQAIVDAYVSAKMRTDPAFISAQEKLERESEVVPVALELGIVMLGRAQNQTDPETRKTQLQAAEQVFLAVGGIAGQSDAYRLSLGQVYYWLGKQADGRKLFDDYLVSKGRAYVNLMEIATKLRQLGADPDSRTLMEEAYNKASTGQERNDAAGMRAVASKDIDDEIEWLGKCDTALSPDIKARLAKARGDKAANQGRDEEAVSQFRQSIDVYESLPRSPTTLNQAALGYSAIFRCNGDRAALERSMDCFQQAVALDPADSILLYNAGNSIMSGALADVIGDAIDLRLVQESGSVRILSYLYNDQASRDQLVARVKSHPGMIKALSFFDKVMVLSPKNSRSYDDTFSILRFTRDEPGMKSLERRIRAADIDLKDEVGHWKEYTDGSKDVQTVEVLRTGLKHMEKITGPARLKGGATAAYVIDSQVGIMMSLDVFGQSVDADQILSLAEEAARLSPSAATLSTLKSAYLLRASKDLTRTNASFDAGRRKFGRTLGVASTLVITAGQDPAFQSQVRNHPLVQKAIALEHDTTKRYPESSSGFDWAFAKCFDTPAYADQIAGNARQSPRLVLEQSIDCLLGPMHLNDAVEQYWLMQIVGRPDEGTAALHAVASYGFPVPTLK